MKLKFWKKAPSGPYVGRLAFDSPSGFHIDPKGFPVVTDDAGKTWRYAVQGDQSHQQRYHQHPAFLVGTTETDPHHLFPTPDDPHYCDGATDPESGNVTQTRVLNSPDTAAPLETSHTEAYRV